MKSTAGAFWSSEIRPVALGYPSGQSSSGCQKTSETLEPVISLNARHKKDVHGRLLPGQSEPAPYTID